VAQPDDHLAAEFLDHRDIRPGEAGSFRAAAQGQHAERTVTRHQRRGQRVLRAQPGNGVAQ